VLFLPFHYGYWDAGGAAPADEAGRAANELTITTGTRSPSSRCSRRPRLRSPASPAGTAPRPPRRPPRPGPHPWTCADPGRRPRPRRGTDRRRHRGTAMSKLPLALRELHCSETLWGSRTRTWCL